MHPLDLDPDLVHKAQAGDSAARQIVLRSVAKWLPSASALRYPAYGGREDLCQDVLLQVHLGLDRLQDPRHFKAWCFGVMRNCASVRFRNERRHPSEPMADLDALVPEVCAHGVAFRLDGMLLHPCCSPAYLSHPRTGQGEPPSVRPS